MGKVREGILSFLLIGMAMSWYCTHASGWLPLSARVAWHWLTLPTERLGLRVVDRGDRFHTILILWDQVKFGETSNLEINDGGYRTSLTREQNGGGLSIQRRSENVNIRLRVLRRVGAPLAETVNFVGSPITQKPAQAAVSVPQHAPMLSTYPTMDN